MATTHCSNACGSIIETGIDTYPYCSEECRREDERPRSRPSVPGFYLF